MTDSMISFSPGKKYCSFNVTFEASMWCGAHVRTRRWGSCVNFCCRSGAGGGEPLLLFLMVMEEYEIKARMFDELARNMFFCLEWVLSFTYCMSMINVLKATTLHQLTLDWDTIDGHKCCTMCFLIEQFVQLVYLRRKLDAFIDLCMKFHHHYSNILRMWCKLTSTTNKRNHRKLVLKHYSRYYESWYDFTWLGFANVKRTIWVPSGGYPTR